MMQPMDRTIVLGGRGQMARLMLPYLDPPTTLIDPKTLEKLGVTRYLPHDRALRRQAAAELKAASRVDRDAAGVRSLCLLSIPNAVYRRVEEAPGECNLTQLLGVSGRGYNATMFVHQTSVHSLPARVLEPVSGVVLGLHLLHGPGVTSFREQTAIITASVGERSHDRYEEACALLTSLLRKRMGYGQVFQMMPDRHDRIMANIQFLTHSMLLILGDALLGSGYRIQPENFHELPSSILVLLGRMARQSAHVYHGIATENPCNREVADTLRALGSVHGDEAADWVRDAARLVGYVRDRLVRETRMTESEQRFISTPMSRVRDGIINHARANAGQSSRQHSVDLGSYVERYLGALRGDYALYFNGVMEKAGAALEVMDVERLTMRKYEGMR